MPTWPVYALSVPLMIYLALPVRPDTAVVGDSYWQASALDVYGRERGLPSAYGPERGYWYAGGPPADTTHVLYVGGEAEALREFFGDVRRVSTVRLDTQAPVANQHVPVWLCSRPVAAWPELWNRMHRP